MPQQLIYTSSRRGLNPGSSGYCTVAKSKGMSDFLSARLEQLSYYRHLSLVANGADRPIFCFRRLDVRGKIYYVISHLTNTELDFTQRTNFVAHHLVFNPDEITKDITPPIICKDWSGWVKVWNKEPELLESSIKLSLSALDHTKAQTWEEVTHDSAKAFGLLSKIPIAIDLTNENDDGDQKLLTMFAECLQLIEVQSPNDYQSGKAAWEYTFTTSLQAEDNPSDFRWCCVRSSNPPGFQKLQSTGQTAVRLNDIQVPTNLTPEKKNYAKSGYQAPEVTVNGTTYKGEGGKVHNFRSLESRQGETVKLEVERISGVPTPTCQWQRYCEDNKEWQSCKVITTQNTGTSLIFKPEIPGAFAGVTHFNLWISNNRDERVSGTFTVNITPIPPEISLQPVEKKAKIGSSVELKVVAKVKGIPDAQLTYQWYIIKGSECNKAVPIDGANSPVFKINSAERKDIDFEYYVEVNNGEAFTKSKQVRISDSNTRASKSWDYDVSEESSGSSNSKSPRIISNPSSSAGIVTQNKKWNLSKKLAVVGMGAIILIAGLVGVVLIKNDFGNNNGNNNGKESPPNGISSKTNDTPKGGNNKKGDEEKVVPKPEGKNIYVAILLNGKTFHVNESLIEGIKGKDWECLDDKSKANFGKASIDGNKNWSAPTDVKGGQYYKCGEYVFVFVQSKTNNKDWNCMLGNYRFIEGISEGEICKIDIDLEFSKYKSASTGKSIGRPAVSVSYNYKGKAITEPINMDLEKKSVNIPKVLDAFLRDLVLRIESLSKKQGELAKHWPKYSQIISQRLKNNPLPMAVDGWTPDHIDFCKKYLLDNPVFFEAENAGQLIKIMTDYSQARNDIASYFGGKKDPQVKDYLSQGVSRDISSLGSLSAKEFYAEVMSIEASLRNANKTKISRGDITSVYINYAHDSVNAYPLFKLDPSK